MEVPVTARAALLQVLLEGPGYGMDLIERVEARTKGALELSHGSVYPALAVLIQKGLVQKAVGDRKEPSRTYYKLTTEGRQLARGHRDLLCGLFGLRHGTLAPQREPIQNQKQSPEEAPQAEPI